MSKGLSKNENQASENLNNELDDKILTVKEVANILEETPHIVRNWMKDLRAYIPLKKDKNGYNTFDAEALERMKLIKQLHREQNYSIKQIEHYFATGGESYKPVPTKGVDELLAEELRKMREEIQAAREEIQTLQEHSEKQEQFNQALIQRLDEQQQYMDHKLEIRDRLLVESLKESMENKQKESAAAIEQEKVQKQKKSFWQRLFGK